MSKKTIKNDEDSPYESMVRSLTNRGKNKRKVKLVEDKLIQLTFADHSDSEDDEDFTLNEEDFNSDDDSDFDNKKASESESNEDDNNDSDDSDEKESETESNGGDKESSSKKKSSADLMKTGESDGESIAIDDEGSVADVENDGVSIKKVFLVCGICLESESSDTDEILECDNCGITVHEGCYGDIDAPDDDKSDSDAPTEPWFCEPCKAGLKEAPVCELCPNIGGIYKFTDTKKWVHLVCALYTPSVGFRNLDKLQTVVLEDIRMSLWGARECMFCLDDNFSRTGVCISCDAGLCKSAFHVTCGQRNGFLSDIPDKEDTEESGGDILYAHCKLHSVKRELEQRKRSFVTFQSYVEKFEPNDDPDEQQRISDSFKRAKKDFSEYQRGVIQPKQPDKEVARFLSSCPEACKLLAKKAEILGMLKHPGYNVSAAVTQGKISKSEPHLSAEFINYFFKREMESKEILKTLKTAEPLLAKLRKEQKNLTEKSEEYHEKLEKIRQDKENLLKSCQKLHNVLGKLSNKTIKVPNFIKSKSSKGKLDETSKLLNTVVNRCATCKETSDQHLLAKCDTCLQHYHLACLDPPLTRMPKKSSMYLWQCTECDSSDESESDVEMSDGNPDGVRRNKRRSVKEPLKFTPEEPPSKRIKEAPSQKVSNKKKKPNVPKQKKSNEKKKKKVSTKKRKPYKKKEKPPPEVLDDCCICKKSGNNTNLVKCDECLQCYHFQTCLDPPFSKTPKSRYYGWICENCDETDEDYDGDDDVDEEQEKSKKEGDGELEDEKDNVKEKVNLEENGGREQKKKKIDTDEEREKDKTSSNSVTFDEFLKL